MVQGRCAAECRLPLRPRLVLCKSLALLGVDIDKQPAALDISVQFRPRWWPAGGFMGMPVILLHQDRAVLARRIGHENML